MFRSLFAGTGGFAVPLLKALSEITELTGIITQPLRPQGTDRRMVPSPILVASQADAVPVLTPDRIKDSADEIARLAPDIMVVADYGQIIPDEILSLPKKGAVNVHPSLLPKFRGPAPIPMTILSGDRQTGTTIIQMDHKMDHGPIIGQLVHELDGHERADQLEELLAQLSASLLKTTLPRFLSGILTPQEQDHASATTHSFLKRDDGKVAFTMTPVDIDRRYRAFYPWPGIWVEMPLRGKLQRVKLLDVRPDLEPWDTLPLGTLAWKNKQAYLVVQAGAIRLDELQVAGGPPLSGEAFYRGFHDQFIQA